MQEPRRTMSNALTRMSTWHAFALSLSAVLSITFLGSMALAQQEGSALLELEAKIPLGTARGRIDHLAVDPVRKRVFIAELENNSLGIVDLNSARLLRRIADLNEPQGVAYDPQTDTVFVANGGDGTVRSFRGEDFVATARLEIGSGADNIRVDGDPAVVCRTWWPRWAEYRGDVCPIGIGNRFDLSGRAMNWA
jgi:hypothetical protein